MTDVEILPGQKFQPEATTNIPVRILSTSNTNKSKFNKQWDDLPALKDLKQPATIGSEIIMRGL
jgi:hypothetical protein